MKRILPSILPLYKSNNLHSDLSEISSFIHHVHFDVMDSFVDNTAFDEKELETLSSLGIKSSVHLMVNKPDIYYLRFKKYQPQSFTFHCEANNNQYNVDLINTIKSDGFKAGIAIKPYTNILNYKKEITISDVITIMTVEPGKGGQAFIEEALSKIIQIKKINPHVRIEVDGGINLKTITKAKELCDDFVVGSFFFNAEKKEDCYNNLLNIIK